MKITFAISIKTFKSIDVLPKSWTTDDYKNLLEVLEYGDTASLSSEELEEMCLLSLADLEPNESAEIVLRYVFKDQFNDGQFENLSHEIIEDQSWETYSDLHKHQDFFNVGQLLYKAYNGKFKHPSAMLFEVVFTAKKAENLCVFDDELEATIIRLLSQGMPPNTLLKRLLKDELDGADFPDAVDILWQLDKVDSSSLSVSYKVLSSKRWFDDIKYVEDFTAVLELE